MGDLIVSYLFRTLVARSISKGLRMKLKMFTVNKGLVTFNETQYPAATIMSHGLYLARPSRAATSNPALLAVLNQSKLQQNDPKSQFRVILTLQDSNSSPNSTVGQFYDTPSTTQFLEKRCFQFFPTVEPQSHPKRKYRVSLMRNGVAKDLPILARISCTERPELRMVSCQMVPYFPIEFVHHEMAENLDHGINHQPNVAQPLSSAELFVGLMRGVPRYQELTNLVAIQNTCKAQNNQTLEIWTPTLKLTEQFGRFVSSFMEFLTHTIDSLISTLEHFDRYASPETLHDVAGFESAQKSTLTNLHELTKLILSLLLGPLAEVLKAYLEINEIDQLDILHRIQDLLQNSAVQIKQLNNLSEVWLKHITKPTRDLHEPLAILAKVESPKFRIIADLLKKEEILKPFCNQIRLLLAKLPPNTESISTAINYFWDKRDFIEGPLSSIMVDFERINNRFLGAQTSHRYCKILDARECQPSAHFGPNLQTADSWKIHAICMRGDFQFCIMTDDSGGFEVKVEGQRHATTSKTWVQVIRGGYELAAFKIGYSRIIERGSPKVLKKHFTGRYLVWCQQTSIDCSTDEMAILDLQPCSKACPDPPVLHLVHLGSLIRGKHRKNSLFGCNNRFVSFFSRTYQYKHIGGPNEQESALLHIITFENMILAKPTLHLISLTEGLLKIREKLPSYLGVGHDLYPRLRWSHRFNRAFITDWDPTQSSLLIAVFDINLSLVSANMLTFSSYHLKDLVSTDLTRVCAPRIHMLRTVIREYLVVDLERELERFDDEEPPEGNHAAPICMRVLFTIHNHKLQKVWVNGQPKHQIPWIIGGPLKCAGYDSTQLSLFHHRRVFCSDKVVSAIHRLRYKPL